MARRAGSCSTISREVHEPIAGTAAATTGYVILEHGGPWGHKILGDAALTDPDGMRFDLPSFQARELEPLGVTTLMARRPGAAHGTPSPLTVIVAAFSPDGGRAASRIITAPSELPGLEIPAVITSLHSGVTPPGWEPVTEAYLVCTHGTRDACCAELGRPVAGAFQEAAGRQAVWEVSHVGGHRFAANVVLLPDGIHLGRVDPGEAAAVVSDFRAGRVAVSRMRGRSALAPSVQAAEIAVREAAGVDGLDGIRLVSAQSRALVDESVPPDHGPLTISLWRVGAALWTCSVITVAPSGSAVPESCGAEPGPPPPQQVIRALERVVLT